MILPRYVTAIASVDRDPVISFLVRRDLALSSRPILYALEERDLGQADLVLSLLRLNTRGSRLLIARILGRPITRCPCVLLRWRTNGSPTVTRVPRYRIVATRNPRRENTPAYARFAAAFRDGSTIDQTRARGARKRDVRMALREGWIQMEVA